MKALRHFFLLFSLFFALPAGAAPFDRLVGQAYALVLTGPQSDPLYIEEIALLTEAADELRARSIVTIYFKDKILDTLEPLSAFDYVPYELERAAQATYLEEQLQTDDDVFTIVLVGRDGTVWHVWNELEAPVPPREIFHVMDTYVPPPPLAAEPAKEDALKLGRTKLKGGRTTIE